jgi:hypothetical protein
MTTRSSLRPLLPWVSAALLVTLVGCGSSTGASTAGGGNTPGGGSTPGGSASGGTSSTSAEPTAADTTGAVAPPAPTQASGPADACKLVRSGEAKAALGKPVRAAKVTALGPKGEGATCTYESTDFANGTADGMALAITLFPHSGMGRSQYDDAWRTTGSRLFPGSVRAPGSSPGSSTSTTTAPPSAWASRA